MPPLGRDLITGDSQLAPDPWPLIPALRLLPLIPLGYKVAVGQPSHRANHRADRTVEVLPIHLRQGIRGLVIVLVQAVARYRLRHDSLLRQWIIVRPGKKVLIGMRVANQLGSVIGEFRPQIGALPSREP